MRKLSTKQAKEFLIFIKGLINIKGNEWMKDELLDMLDSSKNGAEERIENKKIDDIHKYMKLDVDQTVIDYSLFPDGIRKTLERDSLEMQKWRHGKMDIDNESGFDIVFKEYCKCIQLQVEGLFQYYFNENFKTDDKQVELLKEINKNRKKMEWNDCESVERCTMNDKFSYFLNKRCNKEEKQDIFTLINANKVRNQVVHGGESEKDSIKIQKFINESSFTNIIDSLIMLKEIIETDIFKN